MFCANPRLLWHVKEALPYCPAQRAIDMELIAPCRLSQRDACSDVNYETFTVWVGSARPCPASLGSYRGPVPTRSTIDPTRPQRSSIDIVVLSEGPYPLLASLLFSCTVVGTDLACQHDGSSTTFHQDIQRHQDWTPQTYRKTNANEKKYKRVGSYKT
jgi:hypothetical protein